MGEDDPRDKQEYDIPLQEWLPLDGGLVHVASYRKGVSDGLEMTHEANDTPEQLAADIQDVLRTTRHEETETFYITFGSQYTERNVQHPQGMSTVGYFVIEAPDEMVARAIAFAIFDTRWSMIYTHADFWHNREETER
jgi:hypothetical protein